MRAPILTFKRARRLRHEMSLPEIILWNILRAGRLKGLRFRRQHPVGPYILDFYCATARLAIEIDGASHSYAERARKDASRDRWLAGEGIKVLRFAAEDVLKDDRLTDALAAILQATAERAAAPSTTLRAVPLPRFAGEDPVPADGFTSTTGDAP